MSRASELTRAAMLCGLVLASAVLGACGHGRAVQERFQHEFGCNRVSVRGIGGSTYVASGCGHEATYTCATDHDGLEQRSACVRESSSREWAGPAPAATSASAPSSRGGVERTFDEQRKLHVVKGKFKSAALGAEITMVGAPEHELTTVYVHVIVRGNKSKFRDCSAMRVLINGEPFDGLSVEVDSKADAWVTRGSGRFDFQVFKPLGRRHAQFGVDLCGQRLAFAEQQMPELLKFLEIFSQIAIDAQDRQTAPAGSTTTGVTDAGVAL